MKQKDKAPTRQQNQSNLRDRTRVPGQNPKADDSPDKDQNHDESRQNLAALKNQK
jgi:hypothetical protein